MDELIAVLRLIEHHLAVIASYAEMLRVKETGEKIHEVRDYVVATTSRGDRVVYLYSTHPGLQYRVCAVYQERLHELPFVVPDDVRVWDGEAAPSREGAARKGYLYSAPVPFKVALLPTGAVTDAGLPVHRFHRVVEVATEPPQPIQPAQPVQPEQPPQPAPATTQPEQPVAEHDFAAKVRHAAGLVAGEPDRRAMSTVYRARLKALFPAKPLLPDALLYMIYRKRPSEVASREIAALVRALDGDDEAIKSEIKAFIAAHRDEVEVVKAAIGVDKN